MKQVFKAVLLCVIASPLCVGTIKAQSNIQIDLRNVLLSADGYSATFDLWVTALAGYKGSNVGWDTLYYRADASVGTYNILDAEVLPTSAVDPSATAYITNPGPPPVGSSKFGITFTRKNNEPDLTIGNPVQFGTVTLHFNVAVKSGAAQITSRSQPTYPASQSTYYTNGNGTSFSALTYSNSILPIDIISFTAVKATNGNQLVWSCANAVNFDHFEIQRSTNGSSFVTIAKVPQNSSNRYAYIDANASGIVFYRLASVDVDNTVQYSSIIAVTGSINNFTVTGIYPTPATTTLNIALSASAATSIVYTVVDMNGKTMMKETHGASPSNLQQLSVGNLAHGIYFITLNAAGTIYSCKFTKL